MRFTKLETNIVKWNINRTAKFIRRLIGKKHSIKSIYSKKYNLKKLKK